MREIPLFEIKWDEDDIEAIKKVISSGRNWAIGKYNVELEKQLANYIGVSYSILFNSGTSALHALLLAYDIKEQAEVIVPSFTFISTVNSVLFVGAKPVFAEVEKTTLGLDPDDVLNRITPKTKAILPIHYAGCPCKIEELREIAQDHNLLLIEDAAEAFGAEIKNKKVGTFGDSAMLSFCQNKIITTGEGGCIVTNSSKINEKLRLIRSHGRSEKKDYFKSSFGFDYVQLGFNFRMPNILAALGLSQLKKVQEIVENRRKVAELYVRKLKHLEEVKPFLAPKDYYQVFQLFTVFVDSELRNDLIDYLSKNQIGNKIYFLPVHLSEFYKRNFHYKENDLPVTEEIAKSVLSLPMFPTMNEEEVEYITSTIKRFLEETKR